MSAHRSAFAPFAAIFAEVYANRPAVPDKQERNAKGAVQKFYEFKRRHRMSSACAFPCVVRWVRNDPVRMGPNLTFPGATEDQVTPGF